MKNPPHPGSFIRTKIIEPAGLSVTAAASALQVSRPTLSSLLNAKSDLSGDMALRIEKAFGVKMDTLMRMQTSFDIAPKPENAKVRLTFSAWLSSKATDTTPDLPIRPINKTCTPPQPLDTE